MQVSDRRQTPIAAFTVSPQPEALSCCADLPGDSALYAISVRRLIALRSSFLQTSPREIALGVFAYLLSASIYAPVITTVTGFTYKGLAPH